MLGKESKTKPLLQKKQYQKTNSNFESNKNEEDKIKNRKDRAGSNLV